MAYFHKWIAGTHTGMTAADAAPLSSLDMGPSFFQEARRVVFRLGNTHPTRSIQFSVSASGTNTEMIAGLAFSDDGVNYGSDVTMSGIPPNGISDVVFCRFTCPDGITNGSGVALLHIDGVLI